MESRSFLIVPESGVPCQLAPVRFTPVQARRPSRVTGSAYGTYLFFQFLPEVGFPVGSYKSGAFGVGSMSRVAASVAPLVHPLSEVVDNCVDGGVREGPVPCDGTGFKIFAHRAGAETPIAPPRPLSTGGPLQGRRMDEEKQVSTAPNGGVRFGGYTGPMTTQTTLECSAFAVSAAAGAVSR